MPDNELWKKLLDPATLKAGWNLARYDSKSNFFDTPFYSDAVTISFQENIGEIIKKIATNTYRPAPISYIEIPKSALSIRPGTLPEIEDRIVLQSIIMLLAPKADEQLPDAVYSYRVKSAPTKNALFKEADVLDIPYLKSKTITKYFDPFDPWYAAWPEFDEKSKAAFLKDGYGFLVVTDIAAYFENIQLPLLRDLLLKIFPQEQKIINLLMMFLEQWCPATDQHRSFHRGIPQGTQISSFLGNIFLLPLDQVLTDFCGQHDAKYFRYMDDVRLFTKDYTAARRALLLLDRTIRSLHLNTQRAKTEIIAEYPDKAITKKLIDVRLDQINFIIEKIQEKKKSGEKLEPGQYKILEEKLYEIAKKAPYSSSETKLLGSKRLLKGLSFRTFRRWLTAHAMLGGTYYVRFLLRELKRNPDYRLTRKLVTVSRAHPKYAASGLLGFIESDLNLFPHQHAEILWSFRYMSKIPVGVSKHCMAVVLDQSAYFYVRISAATLLARTVLPKAFLDKCRDAFQAAENPHVCVAISALLMQSTGKYAQTTLDMLTYHPNEKIRKVGKLFRFARNDHAEASARLKFLFAKGGDFALCDNVGMLFNIAHSDDVEILKKLIACVDGPIKTSPRIEMRAVLKEVRNCATVQLSNINKLSESGVL